MTVITCGSEAADYLIGTLRLGLRRLREEEANGPYLAWMTDPEITRYLEARHRAFDGPALRAYIRAMNESVQDLLLGMFLRESGRHIGNIKLGPIHERYRRADIGLLIGDNSEWGKGYATEAIAGVTGYAFGVLGLRRVGAGCYGDNVASLKSFLKAGFAEEGRRPAYWLSEEGWVDLLMVGRLNPHWDVAAGGNTGEGLR